MEPGPRELARRLREEAQQLRAEARMLRQAAVADLSANRSLRTLHYRQALLRALRGLVPSAGRRHRG